jgi:hypothetical protein
VSSFIALINRVLDQFSKEERKRIGVHTFPEGDRDSTHSADVDYSGLFWTSGPSTCSSQANSTDGASCKLCARICTRHDVCWSGLLTQSIQRSKLPIAD